MSYFLAVDSGGTKTRFLLVDQDLNVKYDYVTSGSNYTDIGLGNLEKLLSDAVSHIINETKINKSDIKNCFIGLCAYKDVVRDIKILDNLVNRSLNLEKIQIENDSYIALCGSLMGKAGVNIVAGTGSIVLGIDEEASVKRVGGWHYLFNGDEGSGYWLSQKLVLHFTRQADGREPKTALYHFLKKEYNLENDDEILELVLNKLEAKRDKIGYLAKHLNQLYLENDPIAKKILDEATLNYKEMIDTAINNQKYENSITVSYSGGVFKHVPVLVDLLKKSYENTNVNFITPILSPIAGALLLSIKDDLEITSDIIEKLKNFN